VQDFFFLIFSVGIPIVLLMAGLVIGRFIESSHFSRLAVREAELQDVLVANIKRLPENWDAGGAVLVTGEAVIATDYFKVWVAGLRNLFGGRVRGYETLVERARREAIVRMTEQAQAQGCNLVWNVRLETSTIGGQEKRKAGGVEVIAYGTAMVATDTQ